MDVISAILGVPAADRPGLRTNSDKVMIREDGVFAIPRVAADGMAGLITYFMEDCRNARSVKDQGSSMILSVRG